MPRNVKATTYLGDSVYAGRDFGTLFICTDNGCGPENVIFFEPEVFEALLNFEKSTKED
jgi:hypothetical protein